MGVCCAEAALVTSHLADTLGGCSGGFGGLFGIMAGVGLPVPGSFRFLVYTLFIRLQGRLEHPTSASLAAHDDYCSTQLIYALGRASCWACSSPVQQGSYVCAV